MHFTAPAMPSVNKTVSPLVSAIKADTANVAYTENGGKTYASSLDMNVDLFFLIGASRGQDLTSVFSKAFSEDKEIAVRILQYARDVRGGQGERAQFINLFKQLIMWDMSLATKVLHNTANIGRYKDIIECTMNTPLEREGLRILSHALKDKSTSALCAKWLPRQGEYANKMRSYLKMNTPKAYRKMLVSLSNTVEQKMCNKEWSEIQYKQVPSLASLRYQKAFARNDGERYAEFKAQLTAGTTTIHSATLYPHDLVQAIMKGTGDAVVCEAQWNSLPNYLADSTENILALADVSSSMSSHGVMHMSVALGMYLAERSKGAFRNHFISFDTTPRLETIEGATFKEKVRNMLATKWGGSTNFESAFTLILDTAVKYNISAEDMPTLLLVLSDMEFNQASKWDEVMVERIKRMYADAGYAMPHLVFWNLSGRVGNSPATAHDKNVALVSGFSPSIMTSVLSAKDFSPRSVMLNTVMIDRYVS